MIPVEVGKYIADTAARDAIHIAIAPVVAAVEIKPGEHIGFAGAGEELVSGKAKVKIGIADPFLSSTIVPGVRFWMFLYPNTITGLRHEWIHPAFPQKEVTTKKDSEYWLRDFAIRYGFSFNELFNAARQATNGETYVTANGVDVHGPGDLGEDHDLFWHHMEIYTGNKYSQAHRQSVSWSCSC